MNTTGIQNYLSNVFRPVVVYDTGTSNFVPRLEMSNIDTYSGNTVSVFKADVGDSAFNVYVGSEAGSLIYNMPNGASNVTAVGYGAGSNISNVSNSVYLGYYAGQNASTANNVIAIGANATGNGISNIFIGSSTGTTGNSNIFIGHNINPSNVSNQIRIGLGTKIPIAADLSNNWVGLGGITTPIVPNGTTLDVSGITRSTGGYSSIRGSIPVTNLNLLGIVQKGIIHVCAVDQASTNNRAAYTYFAWTTSNVSVMSAVSNGNTDISNSGSNILVTNAVGSTTYDYSITYFPLP